MPSACYPSLSGRAVFITGGASGIGAAFVAAFQGQQAKVAFVDNDAERGRALAEHVGAWFGGCDVTNPDALEEALHRAAADLGEIDVLVNNVANDARHEAATLSNAAWRAGLAVNLDPVFIASRTVYPAMRRRGSGVIINISSINAKLGPPDLAGYAAAKAAVLGLTKSLARAWGPDGIRVNAISPGWVATERQLKLWLTPEAEAAWMEQVALKRRIAPDDVARLALFLAADDSAMISGQDFVIDGGRT